MPLFSPLRFSLILSTLPLLMPLIFAADADIIIASAAAMPLRHCHVDDVYARYAICEFRYADAAVAAVAMPDYAAAD